MIQRYNCPHHVRPQVQLKHWESAEENKTEKNPEKLGKPAGATVLKSFLFFFPQLLELLSTVTLKLCPGDRPPWLQPTLLNFKDPRAVFFSGHTKVHRKVTWVHTPSYPRKAHGPVRSRTRRRRRCSYTKRPQRLYKFAFASLPSRRRHPKVLMPSFANCRILGKFHRLSEPHLWSWDL